MSNIPSFGCSGACGHLHASSSTIDQGGSDAPIAAFFGPDSASALISGLEWGPGGGTGVDVSFSFPQATPSYYPSGYQEYNGFQSFTAAMQDATRDAFEMISTFTNLTFSEVGGSTGDITLAQAGIDPAALAYAYFPDQGRVGGDIWTNTQYTSITQDVELGSEGFRILLHEIGHALGLGHTFEAGLSGIEDSEQYSVQAYDSTPWGSVSAQSYQLYDIAALQEIYGVNTDYNSGNDVYRIDAGAAYTLWDGGGIDALDGRHLSTDLTIKLTEGEFSSANAGITDHIAIAYGATIENALGGTGHDIITGNAVGNRLTGNAGGDTLYGLEGNDFLFGGSGRDNLDGGADNDRLFGGTENDTLTGSAGNDVLLGEDGDDMLFGDEGADNLYGGEGNDTLHGGDDNDRLAADAGDDTVYGGSGDDRIYAGIGNDEAHGGDGNDLLLGEDGDDQLYGDDGADNLYGGSGDDTLYGGNDNDRLSGGEGNDTLYGGAGNDRLYADSGDDEVYGGDGNDLIVGRSGNDTIYGDAGRDNIYGDDGQDIIRGGDDNDNLNGGADDDTLYGGDGDDRLYTGTGNNIAYGDDGDDLVVGYDSVDLLFGGFGDDLLYGRSGDDTLNGNEGNDLLLGQDGNDSLIGEDGDDRLYGHDDNDLLNGGAGRDRLYAGDGDDILIGGSGADLLFGDSGVDTFGFSSDEDSADYIHGFDISEDKINITDILSGYDPLDDAIAEFVSVTHEAGRFEISVDRDGGGDSFSTVARVYTDVDNAIGAQDLVDSGVLVVDQTLI